MIKTREVLLLLAIICISNSLVAKVNSKVLPVIQDKLSENNSNSTHLDGYLGQKIDLCISQRIKKQNVNELIIQFKTRTETKYWQTEFWGKWILSAMDAYRYNQDAELLKIIQNAVSGLLSTQTPDGYIGNYAPESQLTAWDVWGRKYTLLGLLDYYELTGDKKVLEAAKKLADHLLSQVGPGKKDIIRTGKYRGMPSSSILKPMVQLYKLTAEKRYLDFSNYIVGQWLTEGGSDLINKALAGINVADRFPKVTNWWSWENGQKAYEMMSCYDGLLDLYRLTGEPTYLKATEMAVQNIIDTEINVAGSGTAFECFYHGGQRQTEPTYHMMETCVTFTWMQICNNLLKLTANPLYADQIERTSYNALMASLKFDGSQIAKYSPLEGIRQEGEQQCGMHINCCNANGPRAFVLLPKMAVMSAANEITVNLYSQSSSNIQLNAKNKVNIVQTTSYPENENIEITVQPEKPETFTIALRIPAWSTTTTISVNGLKVDNVLPGKYQKITREWKKDDKISLNLDLSGRLISLNGYQAIMRGPILLARDTRYADGFIDEVAEIKAEKNSILLKNSTEKPENVWMSFSAPLVLGTDLEGEFAKAKQVHFCDFASAGNTWNNDTRYRAWIKQTLNVMNTNYVPY
ncbi:MAG: beta-L-arabinofuranosidase domain-containing protein [Paludibacter sp.]